MKRITRFIRNRLLLAAGTAVVGYVAYQVLLDDDAKAQVQSLIDTIVQSGELLTERVTNRVGVIMDEELIEQNRAAVREAWAKIGF